MVYSRWIQALRDRPRRGYGGGIVARRPEAQTLVKSEKYQRGIELLEGIVAVLTKMF